MFRTPNATRRKPKNSLINLLRFICIFCLVGLFSSNVQADQHFPIERNSKAQTEKGKVLFNQNCASCHMSNLSGAKDWQSLDEDGHRKAPPLNGTGHTWHHPDKMLHQIIKLGLPKLIKDYQGKMLGFGDKLSDEDIDSVLAYIKTYWSEDIYNQHIKMSKN
jgi:mono/diheme cytochrome c family protein